MFFCGNQKRGHALLAEWWLSCAHAASIRVSLNDGAQGFKTIAQEPEGLGWCCHNRLNALLSISVSLMPAWEKFRFYS